MYDPSPATVPVPIGRPLETSVTLLASGARPSNVGVVSSVMLSPSGSLASDRFGAAGAGGGVTSIVSRVSPDALPSLPSASTARAVIEWVPSSSDGVSDQTPPLIGAVPAWVPLSNRWISVPSVAVPPKVGVVSRVMLSVPEAPVSLVAARSGTDGAAGPPPPVVIVIDQPPKR